MGCEKMEGFCSMGWELSDLSIGIHVFMYVCIYVHVLGWMHGCYMYVRMYTCVQCINVCMYMHGYYMYVRMYICIQCVNACIYAWMHVYNVSMYVYMYKEIQILIET